MFEKRKEKILLTALALATLMLACAAVGASGASDAEDPSPPLYSGECGNGVSFSYDEAAHKLTITKDGSGTGKMYNFTLPMYGNAPPWSDYQSEITSLQIQNGVTHIGDYAFGYCSNLTSVTIPNSVETVGKAAFVYCSNLTTVVFPANEKFKTISDRMFSNCTSLNAVTIPDTVTTINNDAFLNCSNLTSVTIPSSVKTLGGTPFRQCTSLQGIDVQAGSTSFKAIDGVLFTADGKSLLQYPAGKTGESYTVPTGVEIIDSFSFEYTKHLKNLSMNEGVKTIKYQAFGNCESLGSVTMSASVETIELNAFINSALTSVSIPSSVKEIQSGAFAGCMNLVAIGVHETNTSFKSVDGVLYTSDGKTLKQYPAGKVGDDFLVPEGVEALASKSFFGSSLKYVLMSEGLKTISSDAFDVCNRLMFINFPESIETTGHLYFKVKFWDYGTDWSQVETTAENLKGKEWEGTGDGKLYHSFSIKFDAETNGGAFSGGDGYEYVQSVVKGAVDCPDDPGKGNHDFKGWYRDPVKETDKVVDGTQFTDHATVYAHYAKWNLTVTFLPGEGTGKMDKQIIYYDSQDKTLSQCGYSKEGSVFAGWQDKSGKTYGQCDDLSGYRFSSSDDELVLTAQWVAKKEYDITGTITNGSLHEKPEKAVVKQPLELTIRPDVDHYVEIETIKVYVGDRGLEYGKDFDYHPEQIVVGGENVNVMVVSIHWGVIDGNVTVTAECPKDRIGIDVHLVDEGIKGFTYTVDGVTSDLITKSLPFDVEIGSDVTLEVVLKEGFLFVKWDDDHRSGKDTFQNVREYIELYPQTKPENEVYEITFDANGGTPAETKLKTDKYGKLASIPEVTRDGYTFVKWEEVETGNEVTASYIFEWDTIVEAVWEMNSPNPDPNPTPKPKPPVITVNINFKPTTGGKISMDSAKIPLNAKVTVNGDTLIIGSGSSKTVVKAEPFNGFVFDSWSIEDGNILTDGEITAKFRAVTLSGISVESSPVKTEYKEGEKFDPTGLVIIVGFDDMSSTTMGYDGNKGLFTFSPSLDTPLSSDDTTVTVYYNGQSTDVAITVTSGSVDDTVMYAAIGVAVAVALAAVAAFFLIRKP